MKAISFYAPHWDLVFRKILKLGEYGVKTRKDMRYSYRGPVLCYTSTGEHRGPMSAHGYNSTTVPRGVVGVAKLVDIKELDGAELSTLFAAYNNLERDAKAFRQAQDDPDSIYPMACGYLFRPVHRFKRPFRPPVQHMYGPVGDIPLYPEIEQQLPIWAKS